MARPPCPPRSEPLKRFLWDDHLNFIEWFAEFRDGAFKDQMNWTTNYWKGYKLLQDSPLLMKEEKDTVKAKARKILELIQEEMQTGKKLTSDEVEERTECVRRDFNNMINEDMATRGQDARSRNRKYLEQAPDGTRVLATTDDGRLVVITKDNLDDFSLVPMHAMFVTIHGADEDKGDDTSANGAPGAGKNSKDMFNEANVVFTTTATLEKWQRRERVDWVDVSK